MHLEAARDVRFAVHGQPFLIAKGETIHTENSLKYGPRDAGCCCEPAVGLRSRMNHHDGLFSVILAREGAA